MDAGTLYGVSVGPGDPELLTLKAVRIIREADVVAVPTSSKGRELAADIARIYLHGKRMVRCPMPMTRDANALRAAHLEAVNRLSPFLDQGKDVAYLCLGDVGLYASFSYLRTIMRARGYRTVAIPGVSSVSAAAATLDIDLCTGQETLAITPASSPTLDEALDLPGTTVIMKAGQDLEQLKATLARHGLLDKASLISDCSLPAEQVFGRMADCPRDPGYLSIVVVR